MIQYCYRVVCSIDLGESLVITGVGDTEKIVIQYFEDGSFKELPKLITGRSNHGCTSYVDGLENIVSIISIHYH